MVAALLMGGAVLVEWAQQRGLTGLLLGTGLAALADAHAPMASLVSLFGAGRLERAPVVSGGDGGPQRQCPDTWLGGLGVRGWRFGAGVTLALVLNLMVAWAWVRMPRA